MIVRGESTIIDYHAPFDQGFRFCTRTRSCTRANDAKIVRSRDAQCNTKELPPSYPASSFPLTSGRERTTLERSDLKSENSGLPVELRMPTVHDLFGRE